MTEMDDVGEVQPPEWIPAPPAAPGVVDALTRSASVRLPPEYLAFLRGCNGGEGEIPPKPHWLVMWPAEEVERNNRLHEVNKHAPGFFGFGSSDGFDMYAFDTRSGPPYTVVSIPFIAIDPGDALVVARDFASLVAMLGRRESGDEAAE